MLTLLVAPVLFLFSFFVSAVRWQTTYKLAVARADIDELYRESRRTGVDITTLAIRKLPWQFRAGYRFGKAISTRYVNGKEAWFWWRWDTKFWIRKNLASLAAFLRRPRFTRPAVAVQPADETTND